MGVIYGLANLSAIDWHVLHQRQPLYTIMSDGSVQNRYTFKILNKTKADLRVTIVVEGIEEVTLSGMDKEVLLKADKMVPFDLYLRAKQELLLQERTPVTFVLTNIEQPDMVFRYESVLIRPAR